MHKDALMEAKMFEKQNNQPNDSSVSSEQSSFSEDPITHSYIEQMKEKLEGEQRQATEAVKKELQGQLQPMMDSQSSFLATQQTEMKAWRRARSDMQLYFSELKKRDKLREEYVLISEAMDMLIDLYKVNMFFEGGDKL